MRKTFLLFVVMVAAVVSVALSALPAAAAYQSYCGSVVAPYSSCSQYVIGNFDNNVVDYPGSGTVNVCEHTYNWQGTTISRRCADNYVGAGSDLCSLYNQGIQGSMDAYVGNNSGYWHTIVGYVSWADGSC